MFLSLCLPDRDHPRIRGEHVRLKTGDEVGDGSSPHTRGARRSRSAKGRPGRIIPAYAGSTTQASVTKVPGADHPRIRGEHLRGKLPRRSRSGSSPHTRGARGPGSRAYGRRRIIPAYAGSTYADVGVGTAPADHPRIRGEHSGVGVPARGPAGSSPHTRGAHPPEQV